MGKRKIPSVKTIGELMDCLKDGDTRHVSIPIEAGSGSLCQRLHDDRADQPAVATPPELSDFDGLMRRCNRYYGKRLSDPVLLQAIDEGCFVAACIGLPPATTSTKISVRGFVVLPPSIHDGHPHFSCREFSSSTLTLIIHGRMPKLNAYRSPYNPRRNGDQDAKQFTQT